MSNSYYIYTEVKHENEWKCVDPFYPKKDEWHLIPTYESGSRSYFGETFDKLRELCTTQNPKDLSAAVLKMHPEPKDDNKDPYFANYMRENRMVIPLAAIRNALPDNKQKQHCGYYHKDHIFEFEAGDRDDLFECDIKPDDYAKIPEEVRTKLYQYYEWDEPWGWPRHFRIILKEASNRIALWNEFYWIWDNQMETRIVCFCY